MDEQVNATLRISAILSHGAEGEANTNKDYSTTSPKSSRLQNRQG